MELFLGPHGLDICVYVHEAEICILLEDFVLSGTVGVTITFGSIVILSRSSLSVT